MKIFQNLILQRTYLLKNNEFGNKEDNLIKNSNNMSEIRFRFEIFAKINLFIFG